MALLARLVTAFSFAAIFQTVTASSKDIAVGATAQLLDVKKHDQSVLMRRDVPAADGAPATGTADDAMAAGILGAPATGTADNAVAAAATGTADDALPHHGAAVAATATDETLPHHEAAVTAGDTVVTAPETASSSEFTAVGMPHGKVCRYGAVKGPHGTKCPLLVKQDARCTPTGSGTQNPLGEGDAAKTIEQCTILAMEKNATFFVFGKGTNKELCELEDTHAHPDSCVGEACCLPGKYAPGHWDLFKLSHVEVA